jgi:hypothetical protein
MALRRAASKAVVAGVAALVAVAVADALRTGPPPVRAENSPVGTLSFTDDHCRAPLQGCRLRFSRDSGRPVLLRVQDAGIEEVRRREPLGDSTR